MLALLVAAPALLFPAAAARADTFVVENTNDAGPGSLRQAVLGANASAGGPVDLIDATGVAGEIALQTELPVLAGAFEIRGPGASSLAVTRAAGQFRIFTVSGGADILLSDLTITRGLAPGTGSGGGILNSGKLSVVRSAVSDNSADTGGGIRNADDGQLIVDGSTVSGNVATANTTGGEGGGGIFNRDGAVTIRNSTVSGNDAGPGRGGGVLNSALAMPDSSVTTVANSTVAGNSGDGANLLTQSNFAGGALFVIRSTLVALPQGGGNCGSAGPAGFDSQGYNLADDGSCELDGVADQPSTDPGVGPLADNGGPTATMSLPFGSPAVDQGISDGLSSDQRGLLRPVGFSLIANAPGGDGADVGAFELQASSAFRFGAVRRNKGSGTAKLTVKVPGPGELRLARSKRVKGKRKPVAGAGKVRLPIRPRGKAKRQLKRNGEAALMAKVTYTPDGGEPNTEKKRVRLKLG